MKDCPICAAGMRPFIDFGKVPVSGIFGAHARQEAPQRELGFDYCPVCCFVAQRPASSAAIDYSGVARPTARQLPEYAQAMIARLTAEDHGLVVEVGCNDGTFLNVLRDAGFNRLLGIEPSAVLSDIVRALGHDVIQRPLDPGLAEDLLLSRGVAAIVVCRHTLEHVPQPMQFLAALRRLLVEGGLACIEVPSALPVVEHMHIHELWDEHVSYFTPANLEIALGKAGLQVESMQVTPYREMQNIVVWARAAAPAEIAVKADPRLASLCADFAARWHETREALRYAVANSPEPRIAMGASHPQSNFLNFSGIGAMMDVIIDDDPAKVGSWLPLKGRNVPILSSSELPTQVLDGTLLLTGFGYPAWMKAASASVNGRATHVIDIPSLLFS